MLLFYLSLLEESDLELTIDNLQVFSYGDEPCIEYLVSSPDSVVRVVEKFTTVSNEQALILDKVEVVDVTIGDKWHTSGWVFWEEIDSKRVTAIRKQKCLLHTV